MKLTEKIYINLAIINYLNELRANIRMNMRDMAKAIDKSPAYITKLEKGEIHTMELITLSKWIEKVYGDDIESTINTIDYIYGILRTDEMTSSKEDSIKSYENFSDAYALISVPDGLKQYINCQIKDLGVNLENVVDKMKSEANDGKFDYEAIECIFQDGNTYSEYTTILTILFTINKIKEEMEKEDKINIKQILNEYEFYSIRERFNHFGRKGYSKDYSLFDRNIDNLVSSFEKISSQDIGYTNKKMESIIKNLNNDLGLSFAYMSLNLSSLSNIPYNIKDEFLHKVKELIEEYSTKGKNRMQIYD